MISAVIITKNESHIIGKTLQSLQGLTDDIVIVDSGSTDDTVAICKKFNARVIEPGWNGYGANKNIGIDAAKHDWILNLDADEALDDELKRSLLQLNPSQDNLVFSIRFKNFFCNKLISYGEWGHDRHIRLFNRNKVRWNNEGVHETLALPDDAKHILLKGNILHYTVTDREDYNRKADHYARLSAEKYFANGKSISMASYLSPTFSFLRNYFLRLGFLDGKEGFIIARSTARYTFLKYKYLKQLKNTK